MTQTLLNNGTALSIDQRGCENQSVKSLNVETATLHGGKIQLHFKHNFLLLFVNNKIKMARKPGKKQKENPVGCTREGKK